MYQFGVTIFVQHFNKQELWNLLTVKCYSICQSIKRKSTTYQLFPMVIKTKSEFKYVLH